MGRITIFSADGCPHCRRAKAALSRRGIPYTDIDVESHPNRRAGMISLSGRTSVPQVFANDVHVGGCDETLVMLGRWDEGDGGGLGVEDEEDGGADDAETTNAETTNTETAIATATATTATGGEKAGTSAALDAYVRLVGSKPDPADPRLAAPPAKCPPPAAARKPLDIDSARSRGTFVVGDKKYSSLELIKILVKYMPREDSLWYRGTRYHRAFVGSSGVTALRGAFGLDSREGAARLGLELQRARYLHHVCDERDFGDNSYYFVLQPFRRPRVLNSLIAWTTATTAAATARRRPPRSSAPRGEAADDAVVAVVDDDGPMYVVHRLSRLWGALESRCCADADDDDDGGGGGGTIVVDHGPRMRNDELYWRFEEDACELQRVDMAGMDEDTRKAFVINVYNVMIKYAFCKVGIPSTGSDRASFFGDVSVDVGGDVLSFDDLEHGILRGNARHPYQVARRFDTPTGRRLGLTRLDHRVHFALNCGATSCPPVKRYTPEAIDEELRLAAMAFCEADDNVRIDEGERLVHLSKLLYWYQSDFARSKDELPKAIAPYLSSEKRCKMDRLIDNGYFSVKFLEYDWSTHDKANTIRYEKGDLSSRSFLPFHRAPPPRRYDRAADSKFVELG